MKITEKIYLSKEGLDKYGPINIVAFGDSVTHGAVASGELSYSTVYWERLRQKIIERSDYVPVNVINAGIGGTTATESLARIETQVMNHRPDLVIVCFGLNDVNFSLDDFVSSLKTIFKKCSENGTEVIYMTPNMLNTYVAEGTAEIYLKYAAVTADFQNSGKMDLYMQSACDAAKEMNIPVCDCYSMWKKLAETEDTTLLLANRINHPTKEMHELFANALYEMIFENDTGKAPNTESTMFRN